MAKIKISTDSTADIPKSFCEELNISVLPLMVLVEGKEYLDGVDISPAELYRIIDTSERLPVSAQVPAVFYTKLFKQTWKEGYTDLIHVSLNSKGSGSYQTAVLARDLFYEAHPEAEGQLSIHIIDSKTYSMAYGIGVIEGAQLVRDGASVEAVIAHIEEWLAHTRPVFVPLDLRCVKKSGRISPTVAFVGEALGLKPLITFEDGAAKIIGRARGERKAISALVEQCRKERKPGTNYAIVYGNNAGALDALREACAQGMDRPPLAEYPVGCVISINTGPNMVGILYRT